MRVVATLDLHLQISSPARRGRDVAWPVFAPRRESRALRPPAIVASIPIIRVSMKEREADAPASWPPNLGADIRSARSRRSLSPPRSRHSRAAQPRRCTSATRCARSRRGALARARLRPRESAPVLVSRSPVCSWPRRARPAARAGRHVMMGARRSCLRAALWPRVFWDRLRTTRSPTRTMRCCSACFCMLHAHGGAVLRRVFLRRRTSVDRARISYFGLAERPSFHYFMRERKASCYGALAGPGWRSARCPIRR